MPKRIVYLGPFNNDKGSELKELAMDSLRNRRGDEFYYLLPSGDLLKKYRRNLIEEVGSTFELNLLTFDDIVKKILEDRFFNEISDSMKDLLLKSILEDLTAKGKVNYYKDFAGMEGFIKSCSDIIREIKRSLIYPEDYLRVSLNDPFFNEIGIIYEEYEKKLKELNLMDREGQYLNSIETLKNKGIALDKLKFIIIDEFYDFRPIEMAILRELAKSNIDIYINIPFQMESEILTLKNTLGNLIELGFTVEYVVEDNKNKFEKIGFNLFNKNIEKAKLKGNINLIQAPNPYLEVRRIFEEVKRKIKQGKSLGDIGIVILSEDYLESLFKVSKEEAIPITINKDKGLLSLPMVREFLTLIENRLMDGSRETLINRVKSSYFPICSNSSKELVEFALRSQKFNNISELMDYLNHSKEINLAVENIQLLNEVTRTIEIQNLSIPLEDKVENYNELFINMINDFNLYENILEKYQTSNNYELLIRDINSLKKLMDIIDGMKELSLVNDDISLEDYYLSLIKYIEEESIVETKGSLNGLQIFNPINIRGFQKDILFVSGLSQDNYPNLESNNYFLNDYYYKDLKSIGIDIKNYKEKMYNEAIKFSSIISSCREELYLSYSFGKDNNISSLFLDEILGILEGETIEDKLNLISIDLAYLIKENQEDISNKLDLSKYLLYKYYNSEDLDEELFQLHNRLQGDKFRLINSKIKPELERSKEEFGIYSGLLKDDLILEDIKETRRKVYSISYLESYSRCPYFFMLNNILQVKEMSREFEEYSPIDIGNVYHEVLRHYYSYYSEEIRDFVLGERGPILEDTMDHLRELVIEYSTMEGFNLNSKKDLLIIENTLERLALFIHNDLERLNNDKEKLLPHSFESSFGMDSAFIIHIEGRDIAMAGVIDRVDKLAYEDKYTIMDYKSSSYGIRDIDHMRKGLSLQLPVYIMALKEKMVVAGIYGIISNGEFKVQLGLRDETKMVTGRNKGALYEDEWMDLMDLTKSNILNIVQGIENGNFSIAPLECSSYCVYKDICRYEKVLEVE